MTTAPASPSREQLLHNLYEAAELEHNLMCTYLYAAFSLKQGEAEGLSADEAAAVARWRREIIAVAVEEMGHLVAVWNITAALGGAPRLGRGNFPLDPGYLPARVVVKLAPFNDATLQHFIYLERPEQSDEVDGDGFAVERLFTRGTDAERLTPMARDYDTVGHFYATLSADLRAFVGAHGEDAAFCGDRWLQLGPDELTLGGARHVLCSKTALAAFDAIVRQGEGAPSDSAQSHYQRFAAIRTELAALRAANPGFAPAWPALRGAIARRLDPAGEAALLRAIGELKRRGCAVVIVSHKLGIVQQLDKTLLLQNGTVQAIGPSNDVLSILMGDPHRERTAPPAHAPHLANLAHAKNVH